MNTSELYEQAGKPDRARVILSEPTKVYTGLRRSAVVREFEAYITQTAAGNMAYYINPKAIHAFYMPENVVEFIPVDTMELWDRARKAAAHIKAGRIHGRELDNAFENYDGDEMCAALWRMAKKSAKLENAVRSAWGVNTSQAFGNSAAKFAHLSDKELSEHAKVTRDNKGN